MKLESSTATNNQTGRDAIVILALAAFFLLAYLGFVTMTGASADLAESNLQANLIRITRYLRQEKPADVLVGSSVAGRLLPAYFLEAGSEVSNLGLDGSRPLFVFEILEKNSVKPKRILLDTSTLFQPVSVNDATIRKAMNSPTASLAGAVQILQPAFRPSSVLYSRLKALNEEKNAGILCSPEAATTRETPGDPAVTSPVISQFITKFQKQGIEVVLVEIPRGTGWGLPTSGPARSLADQLGLTFLEPGPEIFRKEGNVLRFSDGFHLDVPSARKVTHSIMGLIERNHD